MSGIEQCPNCGNEGTDEVDDRALSTGTDSISVECEFCGYPRGVIR